MNTELSCTSYFGTPPYRYIARDTVEEKILQLQESKKKLSEGLITANSALIKGLTQKDLEYLLS
jgi:SNF2 family DNA or RNA helicase